MYFIQNNQVNGIAAKYLSTKESFAALFNNIVAKIPQLIAGILILCIGWWLINILSKKLLRHLHEKDVPKSLKPFLLNCAAICLKLILIMCCMQIIGIRMTIFAAMIGSLGVAAGLALSGTLQNFTSGIVLLLLKPFKTGDYIITQAKEGTILSIQLFYTSMLDEDNSITFIPNGKIVNEIIVNLSQNPELLLNIEIKLPYSVQADSVHKTVEETFQKFEERTSNSSLFSSVSGLDADGYRMMIQLRVSSGYYKKYKYDFQKELLHNLYKAVKMPGI